MDKYWRSDFLLGAGGGGGVFACHEAMLIIHVGKSGCGCKGVVMLTGGE